MKAIRSILVCGEGYNNRRGLRKKTPKGKKSGKSSDNTEDNQFIPICVLSKGSRKSRRGSSGKTGKSGEIMYETRCIDPSLYVDLQSDVADGSALSLEDFSCGCCGADLEDDRPDFCLGPPICEGTSTPCSPIERRVRESTGERGRMKDVASSLGSAGTTTQSSKGTMNRRGKSSRDYEGYVTICQNGVTVCVYQYDQAYIGRTDYTCGAC